MALDWEKRKRAQELHDSGMKWKDVGQAMGISAAKAASHGSDWRRNIRYKADLERRGEQAHLADEPKYQPSSMAVSVGRALGGFVKRLGS